MYLKIGVFSNMKNNKSKKIIITGTMVSKICSVLGIVICIAGLILEGSTTWWIMLLCNSIIHLTNSRQNFQAYRENEKK